MSVRNSTSRKPLAFLTSLMVLFALVVPLIGTAGATHTNREGMVVTIDPISSGTTGGCSEVSVRMNQNSSSGPVAEGETIDISLQTQDTDQNEDIEIGFCDPDGSGPASDLTGPPQDPLSGQQTPGGGGTPTSDCDDNGASGAGNPETTETCPDPPTAGNENPAVAQEQCNLDANGRCRFGIYASQATTVEVTSWYEECNAPNCNSNNQRGSNEPFDTENATFTAGGTGAAENISCTPASDSNPDGTRHEFRCTVTAADGSPLPGITVSYTVTAGPNSEEVIRRNCGSANNNTAQAGGGGGGAGTTTNNQGQTAAPASDQANGGQAPGNTTACGYDDGVGNNSLPGTDTIVAYVNQGPQPGQPAPTNGPDSGEPQVTLTKTFTGAGRTIDCEPEAQNVGVGGTGTITCTVRDNAGNPVQGVDVTLTQRSGPNANIVAAGCSGNASPNCARTNAQGQVTFSVSQGQQGATGTATFRGEINAPTSATDNCARGAGNPGGAPAGVCFDDVDVTWTQSTNTPPPPPQCNDGVDNDGDGFIDYPEDPGCSGLEDNTESPNPSQAGPIKASGNVSAPRKVGGRKVSGSVSSNKKRCEKSRLVKIKKRGKGVVGRDKTNRAGNYRTRVGKVKGNYKAVMPKKRIKRANRPNLICRRDVSPWAKL